MRFFSSRPKDRLAALILKETENDFGFHALALFGRKLRMACAAYQFVSTMSAQFDETQQIGPWIERWREIRQAVDATID